MADQKRLDAVRRALEQKKLDAHLVTAVHNVRYVTGFTGSTGAAIITANRAILLVDSRYTLQAREECPWFEVREFSGDVTSAAASVLNELGLARIGFEEAAVTYAQYRNLRRLLAAGKRLVRGQAIIDRLRLIKDADEISRIRECVQISDRCFSDLLSWIRPEMEEREVAIELDFCMRRSGADKPAFDTIVAAGPNAAYPHHRTSDAKLCAGQLVKLDFGAEIRLYPSDITRTVVLGRATAEQKEVYQIVLDAQLKAIEAIRPGIAGRDVDAVARDYIAQKGYGDKFGHGLGHSLGPGVHDGPGLSKTSNVVLEPGMVMTVEPGIYIEGWGGVRIEDDVLVTSSGCEVLNKSPKMELIVI